MKTSLYKLLVQAVRSDHKDKRLEAVEKINSALKTQSAQRHKRG